MKRVSKLVIYGLVIVGIAIANSTKLKQSESRIALIEERLAVTENRIDYTSKKGVGKCVMLLSVKSNGKN